MGSSILTIKHHHEVFNCCLCSFHGWTLNCIILCTRSSTDACEVLCFLWSPAHVCTTASSNSIHQPGYVPTVAVHNDGTTGSVFDSRSGGVTGSVTNVDACQAPKELAKDAVEAHLDVLEAISETKIDEETKKAIYGQNEFTSRSGKSCNFIQIAKCAGGVGKAIGKCINTIGEDLNVNSIINCVTEVLGSGSDCLGCVCRVLGLVTKNRIKC